MDQEPDLLAQFLRDKTEQVGDCLVFKGYKQPNRSKHGGPGYGRVGIGGKVLLAHRYVASLMGLPDGVVRHSCDNRPCCNPAHLSVGTQQQNLVERSLRSPRNYSTLKLLPEQVVEARRLMAEGETATAVARYFGVSPENMMHIRNRRTWKHLP